MRRCLPPFLVCLAFLLPAPLSAQEARPKERVERDLTYGKGGKVDLKLDLALPEGDGPFPAVVLIHGGGWRAGKRQDLARAMQFLAERGFVAATVSYRLSDVAPFPAQIEDVKAAVRWLRAHAAKYKVDPERIGAAGVSAGAHLACLLGTTDAKDGLEGRGGHPEQSSRVRAVCSWFGPSDLTRKDWTPEVEKGLLVPFFGGTIAEKPELYKKASPLFYVTPDDPPFLFFHGTKDTLVKPSQSQRLAEKLTEAGVKARVEILEGEGHGWQGEKLTKTLEQMAAFFREQLK